MPRRKKEQPSEWISAQEATRILSERAGRPINRTYIQSLVRLKKIESRPFGGRTNEYRRVDVENYVVKPRKRKIIHLEDNKPDLHLNTHERQDMPDVA